MTGPYLRPASWRKSSHSSANSDCVEVSYGTAAANVAVRDSKNPDSGQLTVSRSSWVAFRRELD